eukprot:gene8834-11820_t
MSRACRLLSCCGDTSFGRARPNSNGRSMYAVFRPQVRAAARSSWCAAASITWPGVASNTPATP